MKTTNQLTVRDIQQEAAKYKAEFGIGPHSIWFQSNETSLGISNSTITVVDFEGNASECPINEIIAYILIVGTPSDSS